MINGLLVEAGFFMKFYDRRNRGALRPKEH